MSGIAVFINGFAGTCLALALIIKLMTLPLNTEKGNRILRVKFENTENIH